MIPLELGMIPSKSSCISWHHRDPLRFLCELRITHMIQIKVLLKEGLSTSRHIPLHESDSNLLCQLVIFVINELPSSIQAVGEVARNLNQVSDRDLNRKKLIKMPSNLQPSHVTIKPIWLLSVPQLLALKLPRHWCSSNSSRGTRASQAFIATSADSSSSWPQLPMESPKATFGGMIQACLEVWQHLEWQRKSRMRKNRMCKL